MSDSFGFEQQLVTTTDTVLYTCPALAVKDVDTVENVTTRAQARIVQTQVTGINVTNYSAGAQTFSLFVTDADDTDTAPIGDDYKLVSDHSLSQDETIILAQGMVLAPGNTVWIGASANTALTVTMFRIEVS